MAELALDIIIAALLNFIAITIAALALFYSRKDKTLYEKKEDKEWDSHLDKRVTILEKKSESQDKDILSIKVDVKDVREGFYREVKEIKGDIKNIFNILINMKN